MSLKFRSGDLIFLNWSYGESYVHATMHHLMKFLRGSHRINHKLSDKRRIVSNRDILIVIQTELDRDFSYVLINNCTGYVYNKNYKRLH